MYNLRRFICLVYVLSAFILVSIFCLQWGAVDAIFRKREKYGYKKQKSDSKLGKSGW